MPVRRKPYRKRAIAALIVLAVLCALVAVLAPAVRVHLQSLVILMEMNGDQAPPVLRAVLGHKVSVQEVTLPASAGGNGPLRGRLYEPVGVAAPQAIALFNGAYYEGYDSPSFEKYATLLASSGLLVLSADLPHLRDYLVDPSSVHDIGGSIQWLAHRTGEPVGVMALSVGGGLAILAAADPQVAPHVKFVMTTGAYDDIARVAASFDTFREALPDGSKSPVEPGSYVPALLAYQFLPWTAPPELVATYRRALYEKLKRDKPAEQAILDGLTPRERAGLDALQTPEALDRDTVLFKAQMAAVSPHGRLAGVRAPVYLLHGERDALVPSGEAIWLAHDLPPGTLHGLLVTPMISHTLFSEHRHSWRDRWEMVHFFARVLTAAQNR